MAQQYWLTHPNLTPAHDWKCEAGALSDWARSGWQVRADQSDPAPDVEPEQALTAVKAAKLDGEAAKPSPTPRKD